jgi:hypothetical protein
MMPTTEPTAEPTATPALAELFELHTGPVLRAGFPNASTFIDPGAVIVHDGLFHMFYNGINGFPAPVGVGYATSPDGVTWTRASDEPVFGPATDDWPVELRGTNLFVTSGLVEPDGTWVLYYYTLTGSGFDGRQAVGRATAPAPTGPWTPSAEPVLAPGPEGAWDSRQASAPDVTRTDEGYVMFYDGVATDNDRWMIGRATSPDGISWTKHNDPATTDTAFADSDPVLQPGVGAWLSRRVIDPNAVRTADGWTMIYATNSGSGGKFTAPDLHMALATSLDGITWTQTEQPALVGGQHPAWRGVYLISLAAAPDGYYLFFDVATGGTDVYLATWDGEL